MKYFYSNARLPKNPYLLPEINLAADRLYVKLKKLNLNKLGISDYNQRYLGDKLANPIGTFQVYSYLLALSLTGSKVPLDRFVFVDYGGGCGILSLLAKQLGIGRVIYNDIYDLSCNDVRLLSKEIKIGIDDYVCGDIDELIIYLKKDSVTINAITSYDVIEHIYDIDSYLRKLPFLSSISFRIVFGSGANIKNPFIRKRLMHTHNEVEHKDREKKWGQKKRDSLRSYLEMRKEIVREYDSSLGSEKVNRIAELTRGLMKHDIEKCVDKYNKTGKFSYKPDHPTNTCDPYTGNWAEHLMESDRLENILKDEGFEVKILSGYWPFSKNIYKNFILKLLNIGIRLLGKNALLFSPHYIVYGDYNVL